MIAIVSSNFDKLTCEELVDVDDIILINHGQPNYKNIKKAVIKISKRVIYKDPTILMVYPLPRSEVLGNDIIDLLGKHYDDEVFNCER